MSTASELRDTRDRFGRYIEQLRQLLSRHGVDSTRSLVAHVRTDREFRTEWRALWAEVTKAEGGKLSLTTAGVIVGTALGGAGLAFLGTAIPISLAATLGLAGFATGMEIDVLRRLRGTRPLLIGIPRDLLERIQTAAKASDIDTSELVIRTLKEAFPEDPAQLISAVGSTRV